MDIEENCEENYTFSKWVLLKLLIDYSILKKMNYLPVLQILRQNLFCPRFSNAL